MHNTAVPGLCRPLLGASCRQAYTHLAALLLCCRCALLQVDTLGDNTKKCTYQCSRPGPDPKAQNGRFDVVQVRELSVLAGVCCCCWLHLLHAAAAHVSICSGLL